MKQLTTAYFGGGTGILFFCLWGTRAEKGREPLL